MKNVNKEATILSEFKKIFKKYGSLNEIKALIPLVKKVDLIDNADSKVEDINKLLNEVDILEKAAEKQLRTSRLAIIFSKNSPNYIAKMNYNKIHNRNNEKIFAFLRFKHLLYSTLNDLKQNGLNK